MSASCNCFLCGYPDNLFILIIYLDWYFQPSLNGIVLTLVNNFLNLINFLSELEATETQHHQTVAEAATVMSTAMQLWVFVTRSRGCASVKTILKGPHVTSARKATMETPGEQTRLGQWIVSNYLFVSYFCTFLDCFLICQMYKSNLLLSFLIIISVFHW